MALSRSKIPILFVLLLAIIWPAGAQATSIDSIKLRVQQATTPRDSLRALYDLFDQAEPQQRRRLDARMISAATNLRSDSVLLTVLRDLSENSYNDPSTFDHYLDLARQCQKSVDRDQTIALIDARKELIAEADYSPDTRRDRLQQFISQLNTSQNADVFERITLLMKICVLLGIDTQSDMLTDYYTRLLHELEMLPENDAIDLRRMIYRRADAAYTLNQDYTRAVAAGKELLDLIDKQRQIYTRGARRYANLDTESYQAYRRLLNNFRALDNEHIQAYHDSIQAIVRRDPAAYEDLRSNERAQIYYLVAMHRYADALAILKRQVDRPHNLPYRRLLLRMMIESAQAIGDRDALLSASLAYNQALDSYIRSKGSERAREMEISYNMAALTSENNRLTLEQQQYRINTTRNVLIVSILVVILVAILLIVLWRLYRKSSNLASELNLSNEMLIGERDNLKRVLDELVQARDRAATADRKKSEFIDNLIHEVITPLNIISEYSRLIVDCLDDEKRTYMLRYGDVVNSNVDLLQTIVADLQDVSASDHSRIAVRMQPVSLKHVCQLSIDNTRNLCRPGVSMVFESENAPDFTIVSDQSRVAQVLINLLNNAAKFTEEGTISLKYTVDTADDTVSFIVADTGIGIPRGKEKMIFDRFTKVHKQTQGLGLGLNICRTLSRLLSGRISLDTTYRGGARFIFTLPIQPPTKPHPHKA